MAQYAFSFLNFILDPVLNPLLKIVSPLWFLIIITFVITLIVTLVYKYTTNQELVKRLRDEMKDIQKQMKEYQHDVEKVKDLQKQSFEKMGVQFKQSMKPMIITMIPMIIILGWLATSLSYDSLKPNENFNIELEAVQFNTTILLNASSLDILDGSEKKAEPIAKWIAKGEEGKHLLEFKILGEKEDKIYAKEILITSGSGYKEPIENINDGFVKTIKIGNKPLKIAGLSWFWAYFILAIVFNSLLRKLLKVY